MATRNNKRGGIRGRSPSPKGNEQEAASSGMFTTQMSSSHDANSRREHPPKKSDLSHIIYGDSNSTSDSTVDSHKPLIKASK